MNTSLFIFSACVLVCVNSSIKNKRAKIKREKAFEAGCPDASKVLQLLHDADYTALVASQFACVDPTHPPRLKDFGGSIIQLVTDGPKEKATGVPYFYMHKLDPSVISAKLNNITSVLLTEGVIENRCANFPLGLKDDKCPRAELFGELEEIRRTSQDFKEPHSWFVAKFPALGQLGENDLDYELWKLNIKYILMRKDGGPTEVSVQSYHDATLPALWIDEE